MVLQPARTTLFNSVTVNATATVYSVWQKGSLENWVLYLLFTSATGTPNVDVYVDRSPYQTREKSSGTAILTQTMTDTTKYISNKLTSSVITSEIMTELSADDLAQLEMDRPCMSWRIRVVGSASNPADTVALVYGVRMV